MRKTSAEATEQHKTKHGKQSQNHPQNKEKRSRKPPLTPTVSQEPLGRLLASILAASGCHFGAQGSPGPLHRPRPCAPRGAQGLPGSPGRPPGANLAAILEPPGGMFVTFFHLRMLPGSSFATVFCSSPCVANKALQKTTRRNTRPKELEKFSQAGRGGVGTPKKVTFSRL